MSLSQCQPPAPLFSPHHLPRHHPQRPLAGGLEAEDLFLDIGGQQGQVEELGDAGAGEPILTGQGGAVLKLAAIDGVPNPVRHGEHASHPSGPSDGCGRRGRWLLAEDHVAALAASEQVAGEDPFALLAAVFALPALVGACAAFGSRGPHCSWSRLLLTPRGHVGRLGRLVEQVFHVLGQVHQLGGHLAGDVVHDDPLDYRAHQAGLILDGEHVPDIVEVSQRIGDPARLHLGLASSFRARSIW